MYKTYSQILVGLLCLSYSVVRGQEVIPKGAFHSDSVKIGISIPYSLSISYPINREVVFPDSLFDFSPFELDRKIYFPTHSDSTSSYDSAVYYLSTFEIDSIQYLQLPVFFVNNGDSIPVYTTKDSVHLIELIPVMPDSISLKANASHLDIPSQFNYPYLLIVLGVFAIFIVLIIIIFGKKIKKFFKIRKLKKQQRKFLKVFDEITLEASGKTSSSTQEHAVFTWKNYLEKLEKLPITKLTTKEITQQVSNSEAVATSLQSIDKAIYSSQSVDGLVEAYSKLRTDAVERCKTKIASIKDNG